MSPQWILNSRVCHYYVVKKFYEGKNQVFLGWCFMSDKMCLFRWKPLLVLWKNELIWDKCEVFW